jgi:phosphoserine phosphatase
VDGIAETVVWCRRRGLAPVLATLAWDIVGDHLCDRFGFDRACGPRLEVIDGRYSGEVAEQFDELSKRDFAVSVAVELGVDPKRCAAVGDGRSDVPLFAAVGYAEASIRGRRKVLHLILADAVDEGAARSQPGDSPPWPG